MKKIILFLALALGAKVNAQVVGGYLPINSTKSATMGGLRVNGALTATGAVTGGSLKTGSTTIIGGASNATLTGGNTGTVAVLDDAIWTINCMHNNSNPGDGTTVYFGVPVIGLPSTTATHYTMSIPKNSTLIGYEMVGYINGTPSSAETASVYVRVNNTTDITLSTAVTYSAGSGVQQYSSQALNSNVSSGDFFNIKVVHPTYATNPTSLSEGVILKFKLR